jgi:hypothetical protein
VGVPVGPGTWREPDERHDQVRWRLGLVDRRDVDIAGESFGGSLRGVVDGDEHPGLTLLVYTAPAGTPAADGLKMLASWAATQSIAGDSLLPSGKGS